MTLLRISDSLSLTDDFVTKTCGILAARRNGKSYTAMVLAEEMAKAGIPWTAIDPTGGWWGLRSGRAGKSGGLPVVILGGQHGDVPLERGSGRLVADLIVDEPGWYVIDLSLFESKEAEREFASAFAERLYRRKGQPGMDFAMHLFIDEADLFVSQQAERGDKTMLSRFEAIVRRGGIRGLGTTLISQRSAVVHKNVLEQIDILIALRTVGPRDRAAIKSYVEAQATKAQLDEVMGSIAALDVGEAWLWEPGEGTLARIKVRERETFNSSATPKAGEKRVEPTAFRAIDLEPVKEAMAETVAKAEREDPRRLQARIRELERELAARPSAEPERVEVETFIPVVPKGIVSGGQRIGHALDAARDLLAEMSVHVTALVGLAASLPEVEKVAPVRSRGQAKLEPRAGAIPARPAPVPQPFREEGEINPASHSHVTPEMLGALKITGGAVRMLEALATFADAGLTRSQLGTQAKVKKSGGTFGDYLGRLRRNGFITVSGDDVRITDAGLAAIGGERPPLDPAELRAHWRSKFTGGARRMFDLLVEAYPDGIARDDLAVRADITLTGGTFGDYLGRLRRNDCAEERDDRVFAHPNIM